MDCGVAGVGGGGTGDSYFPVGSVGGPEGFRPGHLLDLVGRSEPMLPLFEALADFVNLLLRGVCPPKARPILFGGNMIALGKNKRPRFTRRVGLSKGCTAIKFR